MSGVGHENLPGELQASPGVRLSPYCQEEYSLGVPPGRVNPSFVPQHCLQLPLRKRGVAEEYAETNAPYQYEGILIQIDISR